MEKKKICSFTLNHTQIDRLAEMAEAAQRSKSDILRRAINKYYDYFKEEWLFHEKELG